MQNAEISTNNLTKISFLRERAACLLHTSVAVNYLCLLVNHVNSALLRCTFPRKNFFAVAVIGLILRTCWLSVVRRVNVQRHGLKLAYAKRYIDCNSNVA